MSDQPTAVDALVATTEWQGIGLPKLPPELTAAQHAQHGAGLQRQTAHATGGNVI